ncbi:ATP-binding protein [Thiovibrio frasassiensis]|uniref:histidine kinase n=1 Tax=Thiovibrio frasassiensis TaxID=2984131 RepID=A0A9X4MHV3_9BACT|nr:ATP-binding protein [Thiovibrio frasassiensis]MDG4476628.1 ATP-binding protein [Thiovibrio frasassiensis]
MNQTELLHFLSRIDLFCFFSQEELAAFLEKATEIEVAKGTTLFHEGDSGQEMYLVLRGLIKIFRGSRVIDVIKPGDYFGEMAIIESQPRSASVSALEDSLLLQVPFAVFQEYFSRQPKSLVAMMRTLSQRVRRDLAILGHDFEQINIMVHDMKNLLTPFHLLEVLERTVPGLAGNRYLECMVKARGDLLILMENALAQSRRLQIDTPIHVDSLDNLIGDLQESSWTVHPEIGGRGIRVEIVGSLPEFPFSALGLCRVLSNLVVNAAQASEAGGCITLALSRQDDEAVVKVIDQGQGIPEELREEIFQPHFTTKANGNGIGLISCKQIIEETHGGSLRFESIPGQGTTFTIRLPFSARIG